MTIQTIDIDPRDADALVEQIGGDEHHVIALLQAIQAKYQYLPREILERVVEITNITPARITGVASFYSMFRFQPLGKYRLRVCHGTACHVKGSALIQDAVQRHLNIPAGTDTDPDRLFTVERVACLGCCTLAPVVQIDQTVYGHLSPERIPDMIESFLEHPGAIAPTERTEQGHIESPDAGEIRIGLGSCCMAKGSDRLYESLHREAAKRGVPVSVKRVGCVGMCYETPLVEVLKPGCQPSLYGRVTPQEARSIVARHFQPPNPIKRFGQFLSAAASRLFNDDDWEPLDRYAVDTRDGPASAFLDRQVHIATEHFGILHPTRLEDYQSHNGFVALSRCLNDKTPVEVIEEVRESGLRGRGGAGFPSGVKWAAVHRAPGPDKVVICNGDEGDPGAFMDRMLLESFPYRIIEGMLIAAYAVGAAEGIVYLRAEYALALRVLREAIEQSQAAGLLGNNILGKPFHFDLRIVEGAGAFVSGEETALLAAVEGRRSHPRLRPPYPAEQGLWGNPTLISNVETFAMVPWILREGAAAFSRHGTAESKGTKVFALAGKVKNGGLIEVPMGLTIREIVEQIGGGVADGHTFKAVQVGGPSGGCVPASLADTPIDYHALQDVGAIMGSGGLVVLDERDCMVDIARYFLQFTQSESCGKCTFCRIGTKRMLEIVTRLCEGKAQPPELAQLEDLAEQIKQSSFCGLGKTAPNPVLTSLRYFRDEYEAHLQGRCPAGKCRDLITYSVTDHCIGCTICYQHCPVDAIHSVPYEKHTIDTEKCTRCDLCRATCPENAIQVE